MIYTQGYQRVVQGVLRSDCENIGVQNISRQAAKPAKKFIYFPVWRFIMVVFVHINDVFGLLNHKGEEG